jgi:maltooligosyltrehalose trehalohydrolase
MTRFEVWAPDAERVELETGSVRHDMRAEDGGWWRIDRDDPVTGTDAPGTDNSGTDNRGTDYSFRVDGGDALPDPRSPWQPSGVHGPSRTYDHEGFPWTDGAWRGRPLAGSVLYELHIGTFTPEGTFDAAIGRLDHLVRLGVDTVEIMPVAAFPGRHGWGYDGVDLWAVHDPYGGPDGLKRFVNACHLRGLAVILDVVYNHLGPSGNYLGRFGPYFTDAYRTPWGQAVNFDRAGSDEVRAFVIGNALMWLRDYHLDGLRLDAVHAIEDHRAVHILEELAGEVRRLGAVLGRHLTVIAESDLNDPRLVTSPEAGGYGLDAHWNDDVHHAIHTLLTGERQGYYADFGSPEALAKTLTGAYFHDGTWSSFRGRTHGRPVDRLRIPGHRFVVFQQNHDQVGNRAAGDRLPADVLRMGAAIMLTSPFTPMLFMGEEWGASTPWCYFTDHQEPELAEAVRSGRRAEFARHGWDPAAVPDPQAVDTFRRSVLDWTETEKPGHRDLLDWYRHLIELRRSRPELTDGDLTKVRVETAADRLTIIRGDTRVTLDLAARSVDVT